MNQSGSSALLKKLSRDVGKILFGFFWFRFEVGFKIKNCKGQGLLVFGGKKDLTMLESLENT